jgi:hypothetical protein
MRKLLASLAVVGLLGSGAGLAVATKGGQSGPSSAKHQYRQKPACAAGWSQDRGALERSECPRFRRRGGDG